MSYIPIPNPVSLPLPVVGGKTITHSLDNVPASAREILVYFFVSVRSSTLPEVTRSYYELSTCEGDRKYMQYMNTIFTRGDYVMNSENTWFPIASGTPKQLTVHLLEGFPWPPAGKTEREPRIHKNLQDAMRDFHDCKDPEAIFAECFVIGYRE